MFQANSMLQGAGTAFPACSRNSTRRKAIGNSRACNGQHGYGRARGDRSRRWRPKGSAENPAQSQTAYSGLLGDLASRFGTQNSSQTAERAEYAERHGHDRPGGRHRCNPHGNAGYENDERRRWRGARHDATGHRQFMPSYHGPYGYKPYSNPAASYLQNGQVGVNPYVWGAFDGWLPDDQLLQNLIRQESGGKANALSHAGAAGVMQVMPGTGARDRGRDRR